MVELRLTVASRALCVDRRDAPGAVERATFLEGSVWEEGPGLSGPRSTCNAITGVEDLSVADLFISRKGIIPLQASAHYFRLEKIAQWKSRAEAYKEITAQVSVSMKSKTDAGADPMTGCSACRKCRALHGITSVGRQCSMAHRDAASHAVYRPRLARGWPLES